MALVDGREVLQTSYFFVVVFAPETGVAFVSAGTGKSATPKLYRKGNAEATKKILDIKHARQYGEGVVEVKVVPVSLRF